MIAGAYYRVYSTMTNSVVSFIGLSPQFPQNSLVIFQFTVEKQSIEEPRNLQIQAPWLWTWFLSLSTLLLLWSEPKSPVRSPVSVPLTGAGDNTDPLPSVPGHSCCPGSHDLFSL